MNIVKHAVIAAAGFGSRLNRGIPKCLVEVNGHKIIEYQLAQLQEIPDVRLVVGYHADEVIQAVKQLRQDVKFIINDCYDTTTTLQSYYMGCCDLHDYFLLLDGDIIPHKESFSNFLKKFCNQNLIGIARTNTEDAVFVQIDEDNRICEFAREKHSSYEWSNIAIVHSDQLTDDPIYVYQCLEKLLPVQAIPVKRLEIDTPMDMRYATEAMLGNPKGYMI